MIAIITFVTSSCFNTDVGKPADKMNKHDVDWFPTLELGHNKLDMETIHAASERASEREARAKERNKRIVEMKTTINTP